MSKKFTSLKKYLMTMLVLVCFVYLGITFFLYQYIFHLVLKLENIVQQPILYSGTAEFSLWDKRLTFYGINICDIYGQKLLEISELRLEMDGFVPKISKLYIKNPCCYLRRTPSDGRWNFATLWKQSKTLPAAENQISYKSQIKSPKLQMDELISIISPFLDAQAEFFIANGQVHVEAEDILQKNISINAINILLHREFQFLDTYKMAVEFHTDITKSVAFYGSYDRNTGIFLRSQENYSVAISEILAKLSPELPLLRLWHKAKIDGQIELANLEFVGLTPENPNIDFNFQFAQTQGIICHEGICLNLDNIQSSFSVERSRLRNLYVKIYWNNCELEISKGQLSLSQESRLNFSLKNLAISSKLLPVIEQFANISLQPYFQMLQPEGSISAIGWIRYHPTRGWDWSISPRLEMEKIQYKGMRVEQMALQARITPKIFNLRHLFWKVAGGEFYLTKSTKIEIPSLKLINPLEIQFDGLTLNKPTIFSIPEIVDLWTILQPEGKVNGKVIFEDNLLSFPKAEAITSDMKVVFEEVPYPAIASSAKIKFEDRCIILESIHAKSRTCDAQIFVKGKVWALDGQRLAAYNIDFEVKNMLLDQVAYNTFALEPNPKSWLHDIQSIWDHVRPKGKITVIGHIEKERFNEKPPVFDIKVIPLGSEISYIDFPYPVSQVEGTIFVKPGFVTFTQVQAKKGNGKLSVDGKILAGSKQGLEVHLNVSGKNLPLDSDLSSALGPKYQKVWNQFSPVGQINLDVQIDKMPQDKQVIWQATAQLNKISACYQEFPYRLHQLEGVMKIAPENFEFLNILGKKDNGHVSIQGYLKNSHLNLSIDFQNISLDQELVQSLPSEAKKICADFDCQGEIFGKIKVQRQSESHALFWQADLDLKNIFGIYRPFPYYIERGSGKLQLQPNQCIIPKFQATHGQTIMVLSGTIIDATTKLQISGKNLILNEALKKALPSEQKELWKEFQPKGVIDLEWDFIRQQNESRTKIHILPKNCSITYAKFPYPIENLHIIPRNSKAGIYIHNGNVEFHNLISMFGNTQIEMYGSMNIFENQDTNKNLVNINVNAKNLLINQNLRKALSEFFPDLMKSWQPEGHISDLRFKLSQYLGKEKYWQYNLNIYDVKAKMKKDSFIEKLSGDIEISGYSYQDRHHSKGQMSNGSITAKNITLQKYTSDIQFFNDYLFLQNITGNFYEGRLIGTLILDMSKYAAYKGFFNIQDASLQEMEQDLSKQDSDKKENVLNNLKDNIQTQNNIISQNIPDAPSATSKTSGLFDAEIFFQGNRQNIDTLTGKGRVLFKGGEIWKFPVFLSMLDLFSLPSRPAFREGEVLFSLLKSKIILSNIKFDSSILAISGKGTVDYDGNLNLVLLTHFTSDLLPRIPFVDKIWNDLRQNLLSFSVQGTISKPSIAPKPWDDVKSLFQEKK